MDHQSAVLLDAMQPKGTSSFWRGGGGGGGDAPSSPAKRGWKTPSPLSSPRPHPKAGGGGANCAAGGVHAGWGGNPVLPSEPEELRYRRGGVGGRHRDAIVSHADVHGGAMWGWEVAVGEGMLQPVWVKQSKWLRWGSLWEWHRAQTRAAFGAVPFRTRHRAQTYNSILNHAVHRPDPEGQMCTNVT